MSLVCDLPPSAGLPAPPARLGSPNQPLAEPTPAPETVLQLQAMLDQVDYPMLQVNPAWQLLQANRRAASLPGLGAAASRPGQSLPIDEHWQTLRQPVAAALQRDRRSLVRLVDGFAPYTSVAVLPLCRGGGRSSVLLLFGKPRLCEPLALQAFAQAYGLTAAEVQVVGRLSQGARPGEVARAQGVALSTVRTQISAIRAKTGAAGIAALLAQVAGTPPMLGVLGLD